MPATRDQLDILLALGADVAHGPDNVIDSSDVVLDAILGYSQRGTPRAGAADLIRSTASARVIALDVPSGLELSMGILHEPHVRAEATMTLAAPKEALRAPHVEEAVGRLYLGDISIPPAAFARIGVAYEAPFSEGPRSGSTEAAAAYRGRRGFERRRHRRRKTGSLPLRSAERTQAVDHAHEGRVHARAARVARQVSASSTLVST